MWLGDLRQRYDVGATAHDSSEVVHAILLQRVDTHRNDRARRPPGSVEVWRERTRLRSQRQRGEVLQLLDQDIGTALGRVLQGRLVGAFEEQPGAAKVSRPARGHGASASPYWNVMSTHFDTSVPSPDAMVMQPRTCGLVLSLAHTAKPPGPKNELVFGGSVSVASKE